MSDQNSFDAATKEAALFYGLPEIQPAAIETLLKLRYADLPLEDIKIIVSALSD